MGQLESKERQKEEAYAYGISLYICEHKQLRAAAFVLPVELLSFSSSFGSSATMQVLVLLRHVWVVLALMSLVYMTSDQMEDECLLSLKRYNKIATVKWSSSLTTLGSSSVMTL